VKAARILIDEHLADDGAPVQTWLDDGVVQRGDQPPMRLPAGAIAAVMRRYGRPLEDGVEIVVVEELAIDGGALRRVQFRAAVDASSRDWLVWLAPGVEPVAALATTIAAPLLHLAARLAQS
jgi:hypothetical protein